MRIIGSAGLLVLLAACSSGGSHGTVAPKPTSTKPAQTSTTPSVGAPATRILGVTLPRLSALGPAWRQSFTVPYGPARTDIGAEESHGGSKTPWGPAGAAPAPDGSWYVVDVAKHRVAHYDDAGHFLDDAPVPGKYLGVNSPQVVGNSDLFASGIPDSLMLCRGKATRPAMARAAAARPWSYTDGRRIYSLGNDGTVQTVSIHDCRLVLGTADAFRTPSGRRFVMWYTNRTTIRVDLIDARVRLVIRVRAAPPSAEELLTHFEIAAGVDGTLNVLITGAAGAHGYGGFFHIRPDGTTTAVEPIRAVQSDVSSGTPTLYVVPGTNTAALAIVDRAGLHAYVRTGT